MAKKLVTIGKNGEILLKTTQTGDKDANGNFISVEHSIANLEEGTTFKEYQIHIDYLHKRIDTLADILSGMHDWKMVVENKIKAIEDVASGKNPEFEASLRRETVKMMPLTKSQKTVYGEDAPATLIEIVNNTLGADFGAYYSPNKSSGNGLFTLLVPIRLSEKAFDFRSTTVYEASIEADVKRWCELVKKNLFRNWSTQSKGNPQFLIKQYS